MYKEGFKHLNHTLVGLILGLIVPITAMHFILQHYSNLDLMYLIENPMFSPILNNLKGCLFFNLGVFFIFYWLKKDKSARGVIYATLIYGAFYLYYMFFM
ncbi:MAG: hypothetical protein KDD41_01230 [Flavobacteriales bacterium]|nr:hypothetical protein [Flavobacteriales bacterium]